jgi:hypothetical protein
VLLFHLPSLQSTFGRLSHRSAHSPFASEYLGHVSTISEDFITHSHVTHHYTFEYSTCTTTCLQNPRKHTNISPTTSPKHHVHRHISPNIIPPQHMLSPNIQYNSYTPRRLLTGSSRTFAHSPFDFLSTLDTMVRISESFYCTKICTGTLPELGDKDRIIGVVFVCTSRNLCLCLWEALAPKLGCSGKVLIDLL